MKHQKKNVGSLLAGTFRGKTCRLAVECYPRTMAVRAVLIPTDGSERIVLTQNLGQHMPSYQAFLAPGILEVGSTEFMDYAERNGLGYIADFKRYDRDVYTGRFRKTAAVFQFDRTVLQRLHPAGCTRYERHRFYLKCRPMLRPCRAASA